jgi:hypothetical protein
MSTRSAELTAAQIEAIVQKLGGNEAALRFLHSELTATEPTRKWFEKEGVIYFSVTSDGTTGEEWIKRLEDKGFRVVDYTKSVLRSPDFKPTNGVTTEVALLKGMLFKDSNRITKEIRAKAADRKLETPNAEIACLIREQFTDEEIKAMGLTWIVVMHEPIKDSEGDPDLLCMGGYDDGRCLYVYYDKPHASLNREGGFAFAVSQVGTQI